MVQNMHNLTFYNVDEILASIAKIIESSNLKQGDRVFVSIDKNSDHEALIEALVRQGVIFPG